MKKNLFLTLLLCAGMYAISFAVAPLPFLSKKQVTTEKEDEGCSAYIICNGVVYTAYGKTCEEAANMLPPCNDTLATK